MKRLLLRCPLMLIAVAILLLLRPAGPITLDETVGPNRIVATYELFGCGSLVTGKAVGVTHGAPECCNLDACAYNEFVPHFQVDRWYFTSYVPYVIWGNSDIIAPLLLLLVAGILWLSCYGVVRLITARRRTKTAKGTT